MRRVLPLLLVIAAPLALLVGVLVLNRMYGSRSGDNAYVVRFELPGAGGQIGLPQVEGPLDAGSPLVVIDAGHGGHDPGAGSGGLHEKDVTLALAEALRDRLLAGGGVRVALTRSDDRYLALEERSGIARRLHADLFISIHADSADNDSASGATVYTLSDKGTTQEASRIAASENRADSINGVSLGGTTNAVSAILVDLAQRQSAAASGQFAGLILREGQGRMNFRDRPLQSAAFVVLKSPDMPSVLFEAGYVSNPQDAVRLTSPEGQRGFAQTVALAIRVYFGRQATPVAG
jgi:N-acetylmuramoyl-L-alanine amidase